MPSTESPTLALIAQRMSELNEDIAAILADAERRSAPLRAQLQRLQIAQEVLLDLDPDQKSPELAPLSATVAPAKPPSFVGRPSTKALILAELAASALPLSKAELVERFVASGHTVYDNTVGSTLSRLVGSGDLSKDGTNRYRLTQSSLSQTGLATPTLDEEAL